MGRIAEQPGGIKSSCLFAIHLQSRPKRAKPPKQTTGNWFIINDTMSSDEKMKKVAAWQNRILDTFRGSTGVSGDKLLELDQIERDHMKTLYSKAGGYATLMDAFLDFYIQSHMESCRHDSSRNPFEVAFFLATLGHFHIIAIIFWRL